MKQSQLLKTVTGLNQKECEVLKNPFEQQWEKYISCYPFEGKKDNAKKSENKQHIQMHRGYDDIYLVSLSA